MAGDERLNKAWENDPTAKVLLKKYIGEDAELRALAPDANLAESLVDRVDDLNWPKKDTWYPLMDAPGIFNLDLDLILMAKYHESKCVEVSKGTAKNLSSRFCVRDPQALQMLAATYAVMREMELQGQRCPELDVIRRKRLFDEKQGDWPSLAKAGQEMVERQRAEELAARSLWSKQGAKKGFKF